MTVTERIFVELKQKNILQKDFASIIGVNEKTVSAWKKNNSLPPADRLSDISDCLGVTLDYLITGKEAEVASSNNELTENEKEWLQILHNFSERDQIRLIDRVQRDVVPELSSEIKEKTSDYKKAN